MDRIEIAAVAVLCLAAAGVPLLIMYARAGWRRVSRQVDRIIIEETGRPPRHRRRRR